MKSFLKAIAAAAVLFTGLAAANAEPATVVLEVATGRGVQITAPQKWLQLLTEAGVSNVRIRGGDPSEQPQLSSADGVHRVVGVLQADGKLRLPGGRFTLRDAGGLRDYFQRLMADGSEGVIEPRGKFGLTEKQYRALLEELQQPLAITTAGQSPLVVIRAAEARLAARLVMTRTTRERLRQSELLAAELEPFTIGMSLAFVLRGEGLALTPAKPRGGPVELRVAPLANEPTDARQTRLQQTHLPVGYRPDRPTRETAPELLTQINAEIAGFTLEEAVRAIAARLKTPVLWDRHVLKQQNLRQQNADPRTTTVELARKKRTYRRILDLLLFQAGLNGELRVDEAGTPFFFITK